MAVERYAAESRTFLVYTSESWMRNFGPANLTPARPHGSLPRAPLCCDLSAAVQMAGTALPSGIQEATSPSQGGQIRYVTLPQYCATNHT